MAFFAGASGSVARAQAGAAAPFIAAAAPDGSWTLVESVCATAEGELVFENIDASEPRRFFKVAASASQP